MPWLKDTGLKAWAVGTGFPAESLMTLLQLEGELQEEGAGLERSTQESLFFTKSEIIGVSQTGKLMSHCNGATCEFDGGVVAVKGGD